MASIKKIIRQALRRSGEFCVTNAGDGEEPLWRPWKATVTSVEEPSGGRVIHTQLLSTTGVPVNVAIPRP